MSRLMLYKNLYQYEIDCNKKMLAMLQSVPADRRTDARFLQAAAIAGHLAACREKWLNFITAGADDSQTAWWEEQCELSTLPDRFAAVENRWTEFLGSLEPEQLPQNFDFTEADGVTYSLPLEVQIEQLAGHALYHRGQITLLVQQLEGKTEDTDYVDWWWNTCRKADIQAQSETTAGG